MNQNLYLRPNAVVEPLLDRWFAWSQLIPPATAAMNTANRHIKIMESYIRNPQIHAAAAANPKLLGGPFIDHGGKRVDEIKSLLEETRFRRANLISLANSIHDLDDLLRKHANGSAMETLYDRIPGPLRGYVELVYDLNNHPSFRLVEPLLYRSEYYEPDAQSLMLSLLNSDHRPSVISTPRLETGSDLHLRTSFNHSGVDELFRMTRKPRTSSEIADGLGLDGLELQHLCRFLTTEAPPKYLRYGGEGARWRYFGHACILVETDKQSILFDPVLSYTYESDISRYTYLDLPDFIDYAVITHNHQDHILFETMLQLRHKIGTIIVPRNRCGALQDPSLKLVLEQIGFRNVVEMDEFGMIDLAEGSITGIPFFGEHSDLAIHTKLAYVVRLGKHSLLFAADSCNIEPMMYRHVHACLGDIDVLFLGMECDGAPLTWAYGPLLTQPLERAMDQSRRVSGSNFEQAMDLVTRFNCREVYVYAMGQEPWVRHISTKMYTQESEPIVASNRLIEVCRNRGISAERLFGEKEILLR